MNVIQQLSAVFYKVLLSCVLIVMSCFSSLGYAQVTNDKPAQAKAPSAEATRGLGPSRRLLLGRLPTRGPAAEAGSE